MAAAGAEVTLFESMPAILMGADREIALEVQKQLTRQGLNLLTGVSVQAIHKTEDGIDIQYSMPSTPGLLQEASFDRVLVSIGRVPNTERLGMDVIGLAVDERGFIKVNEHFKT